ncbi:hypothetical protein MAR_032969, partial [Mya arenaria]
QKHQDAIGKLKVQNLELLQNVQSKRREINSLQNDIHQKEKKHQDVVQILEAQKLELLQKINWKEKEIKRLQNNRDQKEKVK